VTAIGASLYQGGPRRCSGCGLPPERCLCAEIHVVPSRVPVVVVRHHLERKKASNTGGLAARVVGGALYDHGGRGHAPVDLVGRIGDAPRLLLPHGTSPMTTPSALVVLDGTWQQVRAMRARVAPLGAVPIWTLPAVPPRHRMRQGHLAEGMSTMEAVALALDLLGEPEPAAALRDLYDELSARWRSLRHA
jgi:DTW domain-containing protein YfiP